jgi:hypothetical protein
MTSAQYKEKIDLLKDTSFAMGVVAEQRRIIGELSELLAAKDSVQSQEWQEGFTIALDLVRRVLADNDWSDK